MSGWTGSSPKPERTTSLRAFGNVVGKDGGVSNDSAIISVGGEMDKLFL